MPKIIKNYWDRKDNLASRPYVSFRTMEVLKWVMENKKISLGKAIELMIKDKTGLYDKALKELKEIHSDI